MMDYQHSLLSYHPPGQLMPRKKIALVLQCCSWRKLLVPVRRGAISEGLTQTRFGGHVAWSREGLVAPGPGVQAGG